MVPRLVAGSAFDATRYETDPSPCPLVADVIAIQLTPFDAAHVQSRVVAIVSVPAPPEAGTISGEFVTVTAQRTVDGDVCDVSDDVHDAAIAQIATTTP